MCSGNKVIKNIFSLFIYVLSSGLALYGEIERRANYVLMGGKGSRKVALG